MWEKLCSSCGLCCHEKVITKDTLFIDLSSSCEFYDKENKKCKVYDTRFKKCKRCKKVNIFSAMFASYLPETCAYVKWAQEHKIRLKKPKELQLMQDAFTYEASDD